MPADRCYDRAVRADHLLVAANKCSVLIIDGQRRLVMTHRAVGESDGLTQRTAQ